MALPVKIEFLNMAPSESAVSCVHEEAASLEQLYDRIWACHVEIKARSRRRNVRRYEMRVALVVPDTDLVVSRPSIFRSFAP